MLYLLETTTAPEEVHMMIKEVLRRQLFSRKILFFSSTQAQKTFSEQAKAFS